VMQPLRHSALSTRILKVGRIGFYFGCAYSIIGIVVIVSVVGSSPDTISRVAILPLLFYLLGGPIVGAVVGALLPVARNPFGAFLVGIIAGVPLGLGVALISGKEVFSESSVAATLLFSICFGGFGGITLFYVFRDS
jgi:hypothetical protein